MKKSYKPIISLVKNSRGVYCLDPSMGCASGMAATPGGCYGACYAAKAAKLYGYDFSKTVLRHFQNSAHVKEIVRRINGIDSPFVRMGCSGDPSENWQHTFGILEQIKHCNKEIVIITRHWTPMTDAQLKRLSAFNVCVNTSVSALDNEETLNRCLDQHNRVKPFCKAVLRIVSADFNDKHEAGNRMAEVQRALFKNSSTLDTILRVPTTHPLVVDGCVKVEKHLFMGKKTWASRFNKRTFFGKCNRCQEQCGAYAPTGNKSQRPGVKTQMDLFKKPLLTQ